MNKNAAILLIVFSLIMPVVAADSQQQSSLKEFQGYWPRFRSAVLSGDVNKVIVMTQFPFETRGTWDDDPYIEHDKAWFLKYFPVLLASNDSGIAETTRSLIERTLNIAEHNRAGRNMWRVGDFVFEKIQGRWRFVMAYWGPEE